MAGFSRRLIFEELQRILASREFSRSPQLSRFLRFAVEETLAARGEGIKEYVIGVKVYGRGDTFDPRVDPIVRVQANKLRARLASYYAGSNSASLLRIEFPKGAYVPVFRENRVPQRAGHRIRRWHPGVLASFGSLTLVALLLFWRFELTRRSAYRPMPDRLTFDSGWSSHPAVCRDGSLLAYASDRPDGGNVDIWIRDLRGQEVRRLTTHPAIDWTPDFSPDCRRIAFRSFRDGGGIYSMPVAGGPETLLVPGGFEPRFSPDGRWIAYSAVEQSANGSIYVVPADGGVSRRIQAQNFSAGCPVWTPDGRGLVFKMSETDAKHDWWLAPFDPAVTAPVSAQRIGIHQALVNVEGSGVDMWPCPGDWLGREMFFVKGEALYRIPFLAGTWRPQPSHSLVLSSPRIEQRVRAWPPAGGGRSVVFSQGESLDHIWAVPLRPGGEAGGEPKQLTFDASVHGGFYGGGVSLSRDGQLLTYPSHIAGPGRRILFHNLLSGTDRPLSPPSQYASKPVLSPDGRRVAWLAERDGKRAIFSAETAGGEGREICSACGVPKAWSPDASILLYTDDQDLWSLEVLSGNRKCLFKRPGYELIDAGFSPDGRWLTLVVGIAGKPKLQGVLAPFEEVAAEQRWVPIVEEDYNLALAWAAEGDTVYYLSRRDDFRCLYRQRLRVSDKQPSGPPVAIRHFHAHQNSPNAGSPIAVARDKVVLLLRSSQATLWRLDLPDDSH